MVALNINLRIISVGVQPIIDNLFIPFLYFFEIPGKSQPPRGAGRATSKHGGEGTKE